MKEQDFIHTIDEKTKDLPIPDSISPENMKNMLDEHIKDTSDSNMKKTATGAVDSMSGTGKRRRSTRRFVAAACVLLCLVGSIGIYNLVQPNENTESAKETLDSGATLQAADEYDDVEDGAADTAQENEDLVYRTTLSSPASYDEYYDTLKAAYDEYYDRLSQVETSGIRVGSVEDLTNGRGLAIAEDTDDVAVEAAGAAADIATNSMEDAASYSTTSSKETQKQMAVAGNYSSTNTQEHSVDEGDVIKTDGKYIYKLVCGFDNEVQDYVNRIFITKADKGNLSAIATINLDEGLAPGENDYINFHEFYIYNDILVGLYTKDSWGENYSSHSTETYIVLYDLKGLDRDKDVKVEPKVLKTFTQSGTFVSSRISEGYLYTISNFSDTSLTQKVPYTNYIPTINGDMIDCVNIYFPKDILMETTYVVTSLDLSNPTDFKDEKAIPTKGGDTYVSDSSIYFYRTLYEEVTQTEIMKVSYDKGILTPRNSAVITGYLYDSFALSEFKNHLRIVAIIPANNIALLRLDAAFMQPTNGTNNTEVKEDVNALYILDDSMQLTGKLTGIAPGERIHSARFLGDIGYFVTYRNTDPLFSVDLSDPANPEIIGELKIPGFSNYLHLYDNNLLLGLGEETNPETLESLGLKLSMFDISDPGNVEEKDKYIIEHSDYSEAQSNHKALMIDPIKNIFGFMFFGYANGDYSYYYVTYTYDKQNGFTETARYRINDGSEYNMNAVRSVYIGDYLYLATNKSITSYEIGSTTAIATVYYK